MKPASVVVLILAAILVITGVIFCLAGNSTAKKDGMDLFTQERDGVPYIKQEFSAGKISKIEIDVKDATVNVVGGDINSYIEFNNYNPNMYNLDVTSQTIGFEEIEDIKSLFNIWENGFGFKGYRNILSFRNLRSGSGEKTINVHLGDGSLISSIIIKGKNVKVNVQNAEIKKDLKIDAENTTLEISVFAAGASVVLSSGESTINLDSVTCGTLNVNSKNAFLTSVDSDIGNIALDIGKGSVQMENKLRGKNTEYDFTTKSGAITVNGEPVEGTSYSVKPDSEGTDFSYRIKTDSANVAFGIITAEEPAESETVPENEP